MFESFSLHSKEKSITAARTCEAAAAHPGATHIMRWLLAPLLALAVFAMAVDSAEARRMGGGKSFGSKPSYNKPAPAKEAAGKEQSTAAGQQAAATKNASLSRTGGFGGMLGGLLMGGLIGSLLFGGGFGGGVGLLELLLLGFAGFMLFRFIRSRRTAAAGAPARGHTYAYAGTGAAESAPAGTHDGWASLRSAPARKEQPAQAAAPTLPADFDEAEFLSGAKALFARLQDSWDRRDLDDIRKFASAEVMSQLEREAAKDPTPGRTDVLMVDARVLEVQIHGRETVVSVLYDALLREDQAASHPDQVREVWHLRRDESATKPEWILEGIQQLEV
ncbi:MAG: Tim44 domain-containing protein [Desulfovibrionales bacterium]